MTDGLSALAAAARSTATTNFLCRCRITRAFLEMSKEQLVLRLLSYVAYAGAVIIGVLLVAHLMDAARTRVQTPAFPADSLVEGLRSRLFWRVSRSTR